MAYKQTVPIPTDEGGTGGATFIPYTVVCGGTTGTSNLQSVASVGTMGDVLTSNGTGTLPTFQTLSGSSITFNADSGSATPIAGALTVAGSHGINTTGSSNTLTIALDNSIVLGDLTPINPGDAALELGSGNLLIDGGNIILPTTIDANNGVIQISSSPFMHAFGTNNTFLGANSGNFSSVGGGGNVAVGTNALQSLNSATVNCAFGVAALFNCTNSSANVAVGSVSLSTLTTGSGNNTAIGDESLHNLAMGAHNVAIGESAGKGYTGPESSNIIIGSQVLGTVNESNTCRIGNGTGSSAGQLSATHISGIQGTNVGSVASVVSISGDQLGSTTLTGGTGISITPGANTITFDVSGTVTSITGDTGTSVTDAVTLTGGSSGLSFDGAVSTLTASFVGITVNGGAISLGTDAADDAINIGTNASFARVVTIGNGVSSSQTIIDCGGAGANFGTTSNAHPTNVGSTSGASTTTIDCGTGGANFGTSAVTHTTTVGSTTGSSDTIVQAGSGGITITGLVTTADTFGNTVGVSGVPVVVDNTGLLGTVVSSIRYKDNVRDMNDASSALLDLRPVTFSYKSDPSREKRYGLIAEEVADIMPDLAVYNKTGDVESVKYHEFPALLLNELQKALKRIDELEYRLEKLNHGKY